MEKEEAKRERNVQLREFFYGVLLFAVLVSACLWFGQGVPYPEIYFVIVGPLLAIYVLLLVLVAFYLKKPRVALGGAAPLVLYPFLITVLTFFLGLANVFFESLRGP